MRGKLLTILALLLLLVVTSAAPISARAEGGPRPTPEPFKPPWITGKNPAVSLSTTEQGVLNSSGIIESWQGVEVPLLAAPPSYVDLAPQLVGEEPTFVVSLAVPQHYQNPADVTCGAAALGMALEFLSLYGEGQAPSQDTLVSNLKNNGLLYETGTGVEELAYLARGHGYRGTIAFHNWTLEQITEQLHLGKPVVVSLGTENEQAPGHFVTLTGVSSDGEWVSYNDPILGAQTVPAKEFLKSWNQQGNSGLVVQKAPLSTVDDPMLPWMGLFSAITMMAVMAKHYPLNEEIRGVLAGIRGALSNPRRSGLGGALVDSPGGGGNSSSPPYTAPPGYKWDKKVVPRYGWKKVDIVEEVKVPNMVRTWAVIKVNRWIEKKPVYKTVTMDRGHWSYRTVTKYRTERYRTKQRYSVKKTYWYRRNGRLRRGSYSVWKTRTVVKTRRVPYTKREKTWVPKIVREKRLVRTDEIEHRDPVYGWRMEKHGTKIVQCTKSVDAWKQVGLKIEWELKKDPEPTPTPPKPTPTPVIPTSTATPLYPTLGLSESESQTQSSMQTATPWPTGTQSATPPSTSNLIPTTTPTSQYDWLYNGTNTPVPTGTSVPPKDFIAESGFEGKWVGKILRLIRTTGKITTATSIMYKTLESGQVSISAPTRLVGTRRSFLQDYGFNGTKYNSSTVTGITGKHLVTGALSKASWITAGVTALIGNVIDYGVGKNKDKGFGQEFVVSTAVDIVMTIGIGFLAAGAVALGTAALGVTLAVPAAIAATVVVGLVIGGVLDSAGVGAYVKDMTNDAIDAIEVGVNDLAQEVSNGIEAWKEVADNAKLIGGVIRDRITSTIDSVSNKITNTVNSIIKGLEDTINAIGSAISNTTEWINDSIEQTISNTVNSLGNFLGNVFGGGG